MYINKNSRIVCRVAIGSENVNKRKWTGLSKRSITLHRGSEQNHIDLRDLIGEKERQIFAQLDQSDTIWGKTQPWIRL